MDIDGRVRVNKGFKNSRYAAKIAAYVSKLEEIRKDCLCDNPNCVTFFRGVNFNLSREENVPSIFRRKYQFCLRNEDLIFKDVLANRPEYFSKCKSTFDRLEVMQHYGLPTRLLDVTKNYLVALYFACNGGDGDGKIFVYSLDKKCLKYRDDEVVSVLSNFSLMPADFRINIHEEEYRDSFHYRQLLSRVQEEKPTVKEIDKDYFRNYVVCVMPERNNARIIVQEGAFLLFGMSGGEKISQVSFCDKINQHIACSEVSVLKDDKEQLLSELAEMGISEENLFPELEHYRAKIERQYGVR